MDPVSPRSVDSKIARFDERESHLKHVAARNTDIEDIKRDVASSVIQGIKYAQIVESLAPAVIENKEDIADLKKRNAALEKTVIEQQKAIAELQKAVGIKPASLKDRATVSALTSRAHSFLANASNDIRKINKFLSLPVKVWTPGIGKIAFVVSRFPESSKQTLQHCCLNFVRLIWEILYEHSIYTVGALVPAKIAKTLGSESDSSTTKCHGFHLNHFGPSFLGGWRFGSMVGYRDPWIVEYDTMLLLDSFLSTDFTYPHWESEREFFLQGYELSFQEREKTLRNRLRDFHELREFIKRKPASMRLSQKAVEPLGLKYDHLNGAADDLTRFIAKPAIQERIELMLGELYYCCACKFLYSGHLLAASEACTLAEQRLKFLAHLLEHDAKLLPSIISEVTSQEKASNIQFVPGQPIQLKNDGSSCFVNASFWILMNDETVTEAAVDSCRGWEVSFLAFERLVKWLKNKQDNPKPTAQELALLLPMFASEEFGEIWYANTIGKRADKDGLKDFDAMMKAFTVARRENKVDPVLSKLDFAALGSVLDEFRPEDFNGIFQTQNRKAEAIRFFPIAVQQYRQCCDSQKSHSGLSLSPLRNLMPPGIEDGQQDGEEWLSKIYQIIDRRRYPQCFFKETAIRHFVEYDASKEDPVLAATQTDRLKLYIQENRDVSSMPPSRDVHYKEELTYGLFAYPPQGNNAEVRGQDLVDQLFAPSRNTDNEPVIYKDSEGIYKLYKSESDRIDIAQLPDRMLFTLRRFNSEHVKNDNTVVMSQTLKVRGSDYEVTAVLLHEGTPKGGHYTSLVKKGATWWLCDDQRASIQPADPATLKKALEKGYSYFLRRIVGANI